MNGRFAGGTRQGRPTRLLVARQTQAAIPAGRPRAEADDPDAD